MSDADVLERVRAAAEPYARGALGTGDVLTDYDASSTTTARFRRDDGESVIVKVSKIGRASLVPESIALSLLADAAPGLAPRVIGHDNNAQVLVMEDLGQPDERRLGRTLLADDRDAAEVALHAHMRALGRLHVAGRLVVDEFTRRIASEPPHDHSRHTVHRLDEHLVALPARLASVHVTNAAELADEIKACRHTLAEPGPFRTLTHGDGTPANTYVAGSRGVLFDFETVGARHALVDGAFASIRWLQSVWALGWPAPSRWRAMQVYRATLADGLPESADDERFDIALAHVTTAWLAVLLGFLPRVSERDERWGRASLRARIVAAFEAYLECESVLRRLPRLHAAAFAAFAEIALRWPAAEREFHLWPAFAGTSPGGAEAAASTS